MSIEQTREQARELVKSATPAPWFTDTKRSTDEVQRVRTAVQVHGVILDVTIADEVYEDADAELIALAPILAQLVAGLDQEWARQARITGGEWSTLSWRSTRDEAEKCEWPYSIPPGATLEYRTITRYATRQEVA